MTNWALRSVRQTPLARRPRDWVRCNGKLLKPETSNKAPSGRCLIDVGWREVSSLHFCFRVSRGVRRTLRGCAKARRPRRREVVRTLSPNVVCRKSGYMRSHDQRLRRNNLRNLKDNLFSFLLFNDWLRSDTGPD